MTQEQIKQLDSITNHLKVIKEQMADVIHALQGSGINGESGLVKKLYEQEAKQEALKEYVGKELELLKIDIARKQFLFDQAKFVGGTIIIIILGILGKLSFE